MADELIIIQESVPCLVSSLWPIGSPLLRFVPQIDERTSTAAAIVRDLFTRRTHTLYYVVEVNTHSHSVDNYDYTY